MNKIKIYPKLQKLSRADKLKVMQFLIVELAKEEEIQLEQNKTYSIVFLSNSYKAANKLGKLLEGDNQ